MRCLLRWVGRWFCVKSDVVGMLVGGSLVGMTGQGHRGMISDAGAAAIAAALPNSKLWKLE